MLLHKYHFSVSEHKLCWSNILDALILPQYNAENVFGCCLQLVAGSLCVYLPEGGGVKFSCAAVAKWVERGIPVQEIIGLNPV